MNGESAAAPVVTATLADGTPVKVELAVPGQAEGLQSGGIDGMQSVGADGMQSVGLRELDLEGALAAVGHVGSAIVAKLKAAAPTRATVELKFGFAIEAGKLTALWVGGKGEASLMVTLEWEKGAVSDDSDGDPDAGGAGGSDE